MKRNWMVKIVGKRKSSTEKSVMFNFNFNKPRTIIYLFHMKRVSFSEASQPKSSEINKELRYFVKCVFNSIKTKRMNSRMKCVGNSTKRNRMLSCWNITVQSAHNWTSSQALVNGFPTEFIVHIDQKCKFYFFNGNVLSFLICEWFLLWFLLMKFIIGQIN